MNDDSRPGRTRPASSQPTSAEVASAQAAAAQAAASSPDAAPHTEEAATADALPTEPIGDRGTSVTLPLPDSLRPTPGAADGADGQPPAAGQPRAAASVTGEPAADSSPATETAAVPPGARSADSEWWIPEASGSASAAPAWSDAARTGSTSAAAASALAPRPRTRWAGIVWGALFCAFGIVVMTSVATPDSRTAFAGWYGGLGPGGAWVLGLVGVGALVLILGVLGAVSRAQRR